MKHSVQLAFALFLALPIFTFAQSKAMEDQKKAYEALGVYSPKGVKPDSHIYMKASINGKAWAASDLMPDSDPGTLYHVNGEKDGIRIAFYISLSNGPKVGDTRNFGEHNVVDFFYPDDAGIYGGRTGSYTITRVDDDGFEASFHFSTGAGTASGKTFEVTGGTLRFPFARRK